MSMEIEAKFPVHDFEPVRMRLAAVGALYCTRMFEENIVLDVKDKDRATLREQKVLLRLRRNVSMNKAGDKAGGKVREGAAETLLTVKLPPEATSGFAKVCRELETGVADFDAISQILGVLGFIQAFSYEKIRETWELEGCHICLDEVCFGLFVEIEGDEPSIKRAAELLGLDLASASDRNYHELNREFRRAGNLPPQDSFTFSPARGEAIRHELGIKK